MSLPNIKSLIYKPFNFLYLLFLLFITITIAGWFLSFFKGILVDSIGIPQQYFWVVIFLSWIGSNINLPLFVVENDDPVPQVEIAQSFGVTYEIQKTDLDNRKTLVMINVGGAILPAIISLYLLFVSIPAYADNLLMTYIKTFVVMIGVIVTTYQGAQIVDGARAL